MFSTRRCLPNIKLEQNCESRRPRSQSEGLWDAYRHIRTMLWGEVRQNIQWNVGIILENLLQETPAVHCCLPASRNEPVEEHQRRQRCNKPTAERWVAPAAAGHTPHRAFILALRPPSYLQLAFLLWKKSRKWLIQVNVTAGSSKLHLRAQVLTEKH